MDFICGIWLVAVFWHAVCSNFYFWNVIALKKKNWMKHGHDTDIDTDTANNLKKII